MIQSDVKRWITHHKAKDISSPRNYKKTVCRWETNSTDLPFNILKEHITILNKQLQKSLFPKISNR